MFTINDDMSIYLTRGDVLGLDVTADNNGENHEFQAGDVVRFKVTEKNNCDNVVMSKDFPVDARSETVEVILTGKDTKIGDVISKPVDYWYEVEVNPDTNPHTILGYDENGPKIFRLFPEGGDL